VEYEVKEEEGFVGDPHPSYQGVGWMKRYSEKLANFYHDKFGIKMAIVRPTNLYGPRDKFDPDTSHVLPALMRRAIEGADPFEVWGDGTAVRDFVYVTDAIDGMLAVMEKCGDGVPVNIGNGTPVTVRESVETILKLVGRPKAKIVFDPTKPTSIPKRVVSLVKARQVLGYAPKVTFEEGLRKTIDWYKGTLAVAGGGPK
jgi:GDP-L-fucose synthase